VGAVRHGARENCDGFKPDKTSLPVSLYRAVPVFGVAKPLMLGAGWKIAMLVMTCRFRSCKTLMAGSSAC
jgi:hypothetical protein